MRTLTTTLLGLSLLLSSSGPVFAQAAPSANLALIQSCRTSAAREYQSALSDAWNGLRTHVGTEWNRQTDFRVGAARPSLQSSVRTRLAVSMRSYTATLTGLHANDLRGVNADLNAAASIYSRLDGTAEETALESWVNQRPSFTGLERTLTAMQRRLFVYANARDRQIIARVWNDLRQTVESDFSEARNQARALFVSSMDECLNPTPTDTPAAASDASTQPKDTTQPAAPATKTDVPSTTNQPLSIVSASAFAISSDYVASCRNTFTVKGMITGTGSGTAHYQWVTSDGRASSVQSIIFAGSETKTIVLNWPIEGDFTGTFQLKVIDPIQMASNTVNVKQSCNQNTTTVKPNEPAVPAAPTATPADPDKSIPPVTTETPDKSTPPPAAAPTPSFSVSSVTAMNDSPANVVSCSNTFGFKASISVVGTGTVKYQWVTGDGRASDAMFTTFTSAEPKIVTYSLPISSLYSGTIQLIVNEPNTLRSNTVSFNLACTASAPASVDKPAETTPPSTPAATPAASPASASDTTTAITSATIRVNDSMGTNPCGAISTFRFTGHIEGRNLGIVRYFTEIRDGISMTTYYRDVTGQTSVDLPAGWPLGVTHETRPMQIRLHVMMPVEVTSDWVDFAPTCK